MRNARHEVLLTASRPTSHQLEIERDQAAPLVRAGRGWPLADARREEPASTQLARFASAMSARACWLVHTGPWIVGKTGRASSRADQPGGPSRGTCSSTERRTGSTVHPTTTPTPVATSSTVGSSGATNSQRGSNRRSRRRACESGADARDPRASVLIGALAAGAVLARPPTRCSRHGLTR
jgi:hypothetical protein